MTTSQPKRTSVKMAGKAVMPIFSRSQSAAASAYQPCQFLYQYHMDLSKPRRLAKYIEQKSSAIKRT